MNENVISSSGLDKLNVEGEQVIEVFYGGQKLQLKLNMITSVVVENDLTVRLVSIFNTAMEAEALPEDMTYEEWLEIVRGPEGIPGEDVREVLFQVADGYIQWQYTGDAE